MDKTLQDKIEQKIRESISNKNEIRELSTLLSDIDNSKSFMHGVVVGRLYNAFYYQTRRILNREPTNTEFQEFLDMVRNFEFELR